MHALLLSGAHSRIDAFLSVGLGLLRPRSRRRGRCLDGATAHRLGRRRRMSRTSSEEPGSPTRNDRTTWEDSMTDEYDVIIIGSGAGGGTLAHRLAPGKRVLLLERGDLLPRETDNWDARPSSSTSTSPRTPGATARARPFHPQIHYYVGGATKFYGAALYRLREQTSVSSALRRHLARRGPSPTTAGAVLHAGRAALPGARRPRRGPTEPPLGPYPFPPVSHEPRIQQLSDDMARFGLHPFHAPVRRHARRGRPGSAPASVAPGAMATRAWSTPSLTPRHRGATPAAPQTTWTLVAHATVREARD